mgnify:CR=1 FL=1
MTGATQTAPTIKKTDSNVLSDVNFCLKPGNLIVVIGNVGSGKTTLLHSVMKETKMTVGDLKVKGSVAYVEQEPFIFSGSIRDNITFGRHYDEKQFNMATEKSQLKNDI